MDLSERFDRWMDEHENPEEPAIPASTVLVLRDSDEGPEVLMVQRNGRGEFAHHWVFPGGRIDPEDYADETTSVFEASRVAAAREAEEEVDVVIDPSTLTPFSHWLPPTVLPRRFATWFHATAVPAGTAGDVSVDGGEIVDHLWVTPERALAKHRDGEVELMPPTWVTLSHLVDGGSTEDLLARIEHRDPPFYLTRRLKGEPPTVAWHGDAGYDRFDVEAVGSRHRLTMSADRNWTFEEPT